MLALLPGCKHYVALTQAAQRFQIFGGIKPNSGVPWNHGQNVFVIEEWKSLE